jgi:hypothetical protein
MGKNCRLLVCLLMCSVAVFAQGGGGGGGDPISNVIQRLIEWYLQWATEISVLLAAVFGLWALFSEHGRVGKIMAAFACLIFFNGARAILAAFVPVAT